MSRMRGTSREGIESGKVRAGIVGRGKGVDCLA